MLFSGIIAIILSLFALGFTVYVTYEAIRAGKDKAP